MRASLLSAWTCLHLAGRLLTSNPQARFETFAFQTCFRHFVCFIQVLLHVITQCETTFGRDALAALERAKQTELINFFGIVAQFFIFFKINLRAILLLHSALASGSYFCTSGIFFSNLSCVISFQVSLYFLQNYQGSLISLLVVVWDAQKDNCNKLLLLD